MDRRGYAIAFVAVLLLACLGGFFGGRLLLQRFQVDLGPQPGWTPPTATAPLVAEGTPAYGTLQPEEGPAAATAGATADQPRPTRTVLVVATPAGAKPLPAATPENRGAATDNPNDPFATPSIDGTAEMTATVEFTGTVTMTPAPGDLPFVLARPVRNTTGDCPGSYVLGQVTDRSGSPLPDIRLELADEFGNTQNVVSKPGPADKGLYDFPVTGPPRRFTLAVVDASGQPLSERVTIEHQIGADPDATCHWADWQRR